MARAAPLPPDERRARIIAATLPLLRNYGAAVTTAQIAMAAGIAEGTLFRVFPDKESIIAAAIASAFDPSPSERELAAIDPSLPLRALLIAAVDIMKRRIEGIWQLMAILGMTTPPGMTEPMQRKPGPAPDDNVRRAIAEMLEAHRSELRCEPAQAARLLRMVTFGGSHPRICDGPALTAAEIVAVVLDGIRVRNDIEPEIEEEAPC